MNQPGTKDRTAVAVIDDDPGVRELIRSALEQGGILVDAFASSRAFLDRADPRAYDLVLCDLVMPGMSGIELLHEVRKTTPDLPFVVISGQGTVSAAVDAMKAGALDFVEKPFRIPKLLELVRRVTSRRAARAPTVPSTLVGGSPAWLDVLEKAGRVAALPDTILIRGETGTGKEVLARFITSGGPRAGKPFVSVNCAAMPESLIESELFGHVRGAFTGATTARRGLFEEAEGGTLFLDEIGTMPLPSQAKILRALEDREIKRVGENRAIPIDVRFLSATNLDIESAVARHAFRDDLYYRLAVITLRVPPLRDRGDDKLLLAEHFLRLLAPAGVPPRTLSQAARDLILGYPFPGNVRELKHALAQACALSSRSELIPDDFHLLSARREFLPGGDTDFAVPYHVPREVTADMLSEALEKTGGNRVEAARRLGVSRSTLYRILRRLPE